MSPSRGSGARGQRLDRAVPGGVFRRSQVAEGLGAADNIHQIRSNGRLPGFVVSEGQTVDHIVAGLGRVIHGSHPGAKFRSDRLEQCPVDLDLDVHRKQRVEQCLLVGLVDEVPKPIVWKVQRLDRQERLDHDLLIDGALELVVDEVAGVEVVSGVVLDDVAADLAGLVDCEVLEDPQEVVADVRVAAREVVTALAADDTEHDLAALGLERLPALLSRTTDVRVEGAGQAAVAGQYDQHHLLGLATSE